MAKISIDVNELKKNLKATALTAKSQLTELAKKAQKDFSQKEVLKKIDQVVEIVKSQEFMKNPKVIEITSKILSLSEQLEKAVAKNASTFSKNANTVVDQVRDAVGKSKKKSATKKSANGKKSADL